nr:MAG TPA: hypothetical protein [Caudoviricetes sp.]
MQKCDSHFLICARRSDEINGIRRRTIIGGFYQWQKRS